MNFFCKLHPPRASFLQDMTPEDGALMQQHGEYWREWMARGHILAFGVVGDPAGVYGVGIVDFPSESAVRSFTDGDPTVRSGKGFSFEIHPMPFGVVSPGTPSPASA